MTEEFIRSSILVHGKDKYDYSKTVYVNNLIEVIIICKVHGEFLQLPKTHKRGSGCRECGLITRANKRTMTNEKFIENATLIHGDTYDYSKVVYIKSIENVIIICRIHGEFLQTPNSHLCGAGCRKCADKKNADKQRKTTEQFIENARKVHGDTYSYSKVDYKTAMENVIITCLIHGDFEQTPNGHLSGHGCRFCAGCYKSNTEEFIEKARNVHGDTYNYSKVDYKTCIIDITIICPIHGEFQQTPNRHLCGAGCHACGYKMTIFSTEDFIQKAKEVHGDTYSYSKSIYVKMAFKIIITCILHGDFEQTPSNHITHRQGCQKCVNNYLSNTQEFIEKSKKIHGDKYEYHNVNYVNNHVNVIITCKEHGNFEQTPHNHLSGNGCKKCGIIQRALQHRTKQYEFIEKANEIHNNKYGYSNVIYINAKTNVIIMCPIHGIFEQTPDVHLRGCGCYKCGRNMTIFSTEQFIQKAKEVHGDTYNYSKSIYVKMALKIIITCHIHNDFEQTPCNHLQGNGCPMCIHKTEAKLFENLVLKYPSLIRQFKEEWCKRIHCLPYDFCIPEYKIIIELDGKQHFLQVMNWSSPEEQFKNDKYKEECANQNGYSVIRLLQEDVFYDTYDWIQELCNAIEEIKTSEEITNVYLCKNGEYEHY